VSNGGPEAVASSTAGLTMAEVERRHIVEVLSSTGGQVSGAGGAAGILGLHPNTLRYRMKKLGIATRRRAKR
jgi:transcriptional regulator with GAF, ATPase, and Fis domain